MKTLLILIIGAYCMSLSACLSNRATYDPTYLGVACVREGRC